MSPSNQLLQAYLAALSARDIKQIEQLSAAHCLMEIPFIKPSRLVGSDEIIAAHREIFANLSKIEFDLQDSSANEVHAIANGQLRYDREGEGHKDLPAAIVVETSNGTLSRMSLYCDARHQRLWSDKTIM